MVGLLGEQESGEVQGIDKMFFKEILIRVVFFENRDIVINDIMAAYIIGPGGFGFQEMLKIFNGTIVEMNKTVCLSLLILYTRGALRANLLKNLP